MAEIRNFYYSHLVHPGDSIHIKESDFHHIKNVLRLKEGDLIGLLASNGKFNARIHKIHHLSVEVYLLDKEERNLSQPSVHLIQALPKGWKMDEIIEKSTEIGVASILPIYTTRTIPKFSQQEENNKLVRWNKIAIAASKQSNRVSIPKISTIQTFDAVLKQIDHQEGCKILFWEMEQNQSLIPIIEAVPEKNYYIIVGPEGGISIEEKNLASNHQFTSTSLGENILRTETAAPFSIGLILYLWKNFYA